MGYSTIEGMIRQSTNNPMKNYIILKNGKSFVDDKGIFIGTLDQCIKAIQLLESGLDRHTQHSPYTIGRL